ncbi:MAG: hypothetical protein QXU87_02375 [Candidatus Caldarchaeum sp.]
MQRRATAMRVDRAGLAAVAAVVGVIAFTLTMLYAIAYLNVQNRLSAGVEQEARVGQAPRVPEVVSVYIYNASLCRLLSGNLTQLTMPWKLLVVNTGNVPVEVDSIVVAVDALILYRSSEKRTLLPGQYIAQPLADCGAFCGLYMTLAQAQVHTSRGGLFVGGYAVPKPETAVTITEDRRCVEP